jgi:hypothetical protein
MVAELAGRTSSRLLVLVSLIGLGAGQSLAATPVPDNAWLVWASNREEGRHEVYVTKAAGGTPVRLTRAGGQSAAWSPDGRWISYQNIPDSTTHVMRWDGTEDHKVCDGLPAFWMHDNSGLVCAILKKDWPGWEGTSRTDQYLLVHPDLGTSVELFKRSDFRHLTDNFGSVGDRHFIPGGITHDGRWLVGWVFGLFANGYMADNGRFQSEHSSVVLDMNDRTKVYFLGPGCLTATPPAGGLVYQVSREGPTFPDVFSLDVKDLATRSSYKKEIGRGDQDWGHDYFPSISNDNRWLVYGASVACHDWYQCDYEIFLHELGSASTESTRLTTNPANDNFPHLFIGDMWRPEPDAPRLELSPDRLTLQGSSGTPPAPRRVAVWSSGGKPLAPVKVDVSYDGSVAGWLDVKPIEGGKATELLFEVKPAGVASGSHVATVSVISDGAVRSPRTLEVRLAFTNTEPDAGADGGPAVSDAVEDAAVPATEGGLPPKKSTDSGCACRITPAPTSSGAPISAALGLLGFLLRTKVAIARRRRRR